MSPETKKAIIAINAAVFSFSIMFAFGKLLSDHMGTVEISFYRSLLAFIPMLSISVYKNGWNSLKVNNPKLMAIRCVIGTTGLVMTFYSYKLLPLPVATTILFTVALWVIPLSKWALGENATRIQLITSLVGFSGILIMLDPSDRGNLWGICVAIMTAIIQASVAITLRKLGKTENPLTVSMLFMGGSAILTGMALPFTEVAATTADIPYLLAIGATGAAAQFFMSYAYQKENPSSLASFNYFSLIWASLFGYFIWGDVLNINGWIGAAFIIGSNIFMVIKGRKQKTVPMTESAE